MKLDPKQVFIVQSVTREDVANTFNDILENEDDYAAADPITGVLPFTPDDPRLTDEVCQAIAGASFEAICQVDDIVDIEFRLHRDVLNDFFGE